MDFTMKMRLNGKWSWSSSLPPYIILCMKLEFIEELHFKSLTYREALIMYPSPFLEKNSKVQPKNHEMIFFYFGNLISNCFLKADLNTRFISQSNTILTFIWSINQKFSYILGFWPNSNKGPFTYYVRFFLAFFDLPTYLPMSDFVLLNGSYFT